MLPVRFIKWFPVLWALASCAASPALISYYAGPGVIQHFIPPTEWQAKGSAARARPDITYRTNTADPATINISFFGEKTIPRRIESAAFRGDGAVYPLRKISVLYPDPDKRELRITAEGDRETLASLLESSAITLEASIDGIAYSYVPDRHFNSIRESFVTAIWYEAEP